SSRQHGRSTAEPAGRSMTASTQGSPSPGRPTGRARGAAAGGPPVRRHRRGRKELAWAIAFLSPALIAIASLRIAPTVSALVASLYSGFPGGVRPPEFSGLDNYVTLWTNEAFRATVMRTIVFNVIINPLQIALALLVALLMTRKIVAPG